MSGTPLHCFVYGKKRPCSALRKFPVFDVEDLGVQRNKMKPFTEMHGSSIPSLHYAYMGDSIQMSPYCIFSMEMRQLVVTDMRSLLHPKVYSIKC